MAAVLGHCSIRACGFVTILFKHEVRLPALLYMEVDADGDTGNLKTVCENV